MPAVRMTGISFHHGEKRIIGSSLHLPLDGDNESYAEDEPPTNDWYFAVSELRKRVLIDFDYSFSKDLVDSRNNSCVK